MKFLVAVLAVVTIIVSVLVYLASEKVLRFAVDIERQRSGLVRKQIELPDGMHYVYLEGGQGEPLLLLHGFGADKDNFTRVARFLTPHFRVIVPDLTGFGESALPANRLFAARPGSALAGFHACAGYSESVSRRQLDWRADSFNLCGAASG